MNSVISHNDSVPIVIIIIIIITIINIITTKHFQQRQVQMMTDLGG